MRPLDPNCIIACPDLRGAEVNIARVLVGKQPLEDIPPAPRFYWNTFREALRLEERRPFYLGENIPPAYMIRAAADDLRVAG